MSILPPNRRIICIASVCDVVISANPASASASRRLDALQPRRSAGVGGLFSHRDGTPATLVRHCATEHANRQLSCCKPSAFPSQLRPPLRYLNRTLLASQFRSSGRKLPIVQLPATGVAFATLPLRVPLPAGSPLPAPRLRLPLPAGPPLPAPRPRLGDHFRLAQPRPPDFARRPATRPQLEPTVVPQSIGPQPQLLDWLRQRQPRPELIGWWATGLPWVKMRSSRSSSSLNSVPNLLMSVVGWSQFAAGFVHRPGVLVQLPRPRPPVPIRWQGPRPQASGTRSAPNRGDRSLPLQCRAAARSGR